MGQDEIKEIHQLVSKGLKADASKEIDLLIKKRGLSKHLCDLVFHWYFELDNLGKCYKIIALDEFPTKAIIDTKTLEGKRFFYMMVILNFQGASTFSLQFAKRIKVNTHKEHRFLGGIFLTNYHLAQAIDCYEASVEGKENSHVLEDWRKYFNLIYCYTLAGDFEKAQNLFDKIKPFELPMFAHFESNLQGTIDFYKGDYQNALKNIEKSFEIYKSIEKLDGPRKNDFGQFYGYLGPIHAHLGDGEKACDYLALFMKCRIDLLENNRRKVESIILNLEIFQQAMELPKVYKKILKMYPYQNPGIHNYSPVFETPRLLEETHFIDTHADEYILNGKRYLGIPLELKAISILRRSDYLGITKQLLCTLLWPDEFFSYFQLMDRIDKLFLRIKKRHGFKIEKAGKLYRLEEQQLSKISVVWDSKSRPSFLNEYDSFTVGDLASYYEISKVMANRHLNNWIERGWILKEGKGPRTRYLLLGTAKKKIS